MEGTSQIEVVRGRLDPETTDALLGFWSRNGGPTGDQVESRLAQVVCVLRADDGSVVGANSAYAEAVALIGGRRFWVYRSLFAPEVEDETWERMLLACFDRLAEDFTAGEPIGVLAPIADAGICERMNDAIWPRSGFNYVGFLKNGPQARVRYFPEGRV